MLSRDLLAIVFLRRLSIHCPVSWWVPPDPLRREFQAILSTSVFSSLSKIPSQPSMTKSHASVISNSVISGSQIMIPSFPPKTGSLVSTSPMVRDTERQPGLTLYGPIRTYSRSSGNIRG